MQEQAGFNEKEMIAFFDELKVEAVQGKRILIICAYKGDELAANRFESELATRKAKVSLISPSNYLPGQSYLSESKRLRESEAIILIAPDYNEVENGSEQKVILEMMASISKDGEEKYKTIAFSPNQSRETTGFASNIAGGFVQLGSKDAGKEFAEKLEQALF